jgi:flavin-dependent dehydrogenase
MENRVHDVVVMGGGQAGLSLTLQLKQRDPDIDIVVLERSEHPPPSAAHKVGESTVEGGAYYFTKILGLKPYLDEQQLRKSGLRYYFSDGSNTDLVRRVELGNSRQLPFPTYQLDRGTFEARLAQLVTEAGAQFLDKSVVRDVTLGEGDEPHTVHIKRDGEEAEVKARWVVDATGRFQFLKRKFDLAKQVRHKMNASWFRIPKKIVVSDWTDDADWQNRVGEFVLHDGSKPDLRSLSTVHLLGHGWWVWLIPLAGDITSVGIVVDDRVFPISEINSLEKSMAWIEEHEPQAYEAIAPHLDDVLDFKFLRHYSHSCERIMSNDRWCITGVAGAFHDPLFSVGADIICWNNTIVTDVIARDHAGEDIGSRVELYNSIFLDQYVGPMYALFEDTYLYMGNPQVFSVWVHWSTCWYWSVLASIICHDKITDLETLAGLHEEVQRSIQLWHAMQTFFTEWWEAAGDDYSHTDHFIPLFNQPWINRLQADLLADWDDEFFSQRMRENLENLEAAVEYLFWMAVEGLPDPPERRPIDPYKVTMDRDKWETNGLFDAEGTTPSKPVDLDAEFGGYAWFTRNGDEAGATEEAALSQSS